MALPSGGSFPCKGPFPSTGIGDTVPCWNKTCHVLLHLQYNKTVVTYTNLHKERSDSTTTTTIIIIIIITIIIITIIIIVIIIVIISRIRTKVSFAILRGALLCLRGPRTPRRCQFANIRNNDLELENGLAELN